MRRGGRGGWLGFVAVLELALWILAWLGPGAGHGRMLRERGLIAGLFLPHPGLVAQVFFNALFLNLVAGGALVAAWTVKRRSRDRDGG